MSAGSSTVTSPGLFYPDISAYQPPDIDLSGVYAVCIKVTEGTGWVNPNYAQQVARAKDAGAFQLAYHFLINESPQAQAQYCFDQVGPHVPLMVDVETQTKMQPPSIPSLQQNIAFVQNFRQLGGTVYLEYLPEWYWSSVWSSPALAPLKDLGLVLVSSDYSGYSGGGGWQAYGGMAPVIWQYSSHVPLHGQLVDFNAFLGSGTHDIATLVEEFKAVVTTGKLPTGKAWQELVTTGDKNLQEIATACGMTSAAILRATANHRGFYDPVMHDYLDQVFAGTLGATGKIPAGATLWVLK